MFLFISLFPFTKETYVNDISFVIVMSIICNTVCTITGMTHLFSAMLMCINVIRFIMFNDIDIRPQLDDRAGLGATSVRAYDAVAVLGYCQYTNKTPNNSSSSSNNIDNSNITNTH